jgi:hypothetical protein
MTRNEEQIRQELEKAQKEYIAAVETEPAHKVRPFTDRIKDLQKELTAMLTEGAHPCPNCGYPPIGLRHVHVVVPTNRKTFTYEIGCPCGPVKNAEGKAEKSLRSQGATVAEAVAEWNAGRYLPPKTS